METFNDLSPRIQRHLQAITESSGLPSGEESLAAIAENWLNKHRLFIDQLTALDMQEIVKFAADDPRAVLMLTYSGSLISLETPAEGKGRRFEYASIKLRHDVPGLINADGVDLDSSLAIDHVAVFSSSPIAKSSEILQMASFDSALAPNEQNRRLREAMLFLTNGFAKLNRSLTQVSSELEHFTTHNMVQFIAKRTGLTQVQTREVLDNYLDMVKAGMLMGERVPVGRLGKAFLAQQPARKAYMGRNPATGEEMMISARPPAMAPKFSYSKYVKDAADRLPVDDDN